jgi:hypothetical protein
MRERSRKHARLLQQIAVEPQRRHHVPRIVGNFRDAFAPAAQRGESLHHLFYPPALDAIPGVLGTGLGHDFFEVLHTTDPFRGRS